MGMSMAMAMDAWPCEGSSILAAVRCAHGGHIEPFLPANHIIGALPSWSG